ncbi:MAG TPA: SDR family oxidoreductase [Solirubrobacteraceae bacterium]|nr:SDR family oxidoreductase [Solirubrobacteraceae bacterium]
MSRQVAIVTGAASGIGRRFALDLRARRPDMRLVLADVKGDQLASTFDAGENVVLEAFDVRSLPEWQRVVGETVERFGHVDYLMNIAGIDRSAMFIDQPLENIDALVDINVKGALYGMRIVAELMAARGTGHIINIASLAGIAPTPGTAIYSATKFALRGLSLATAVELRPCGVSVTVICPDLVDTALFDQHLTVTDRNAVALIFSGPRALTAGEVSDAIFRAMRDRPLEIDLPLSRGLISKVASAAPCVLPLLYGPLKKRGLRRLERARRERETASPPR